jgi:hypothetical protein
MLNKSRVVALTFATMIIVVGMCVLVVFWDDLSAVFAEPYAVESTPEFDDTDEDGERDYIFLTYSEHKLGSYNFWEDCYEKGEAAKADGSADSVMAYIMDTEYDHNALSTARAEVAEGNIESELEYLHTHPDSGKMAFCLNFDPMFAAAWGLYLDEKGITGDSKILYAEQDLPVEDRPDAAMERFLENPDQWEDAINRVASYLWAKDNAYELKDLSDYTSSMYATPEDDGIPSVEVHDTSNAGGHFVVISYKDGNTTTELKFRLECGYQPVEIPNWTPAGPPVVDNPPPTTEEPPTTTEAPPTELTPPEKQPKDRKDNIDENEDASDYDWDAPDMENHQNNTEQTPDPEPEKNNPDVRVNPDPPTEATTEQPKTEQPTVSPNSDSGSDIVDDTNGKTTESQDGKPAVVQAGDGEDHGNFSDKVDKTPNTTEAPFSNDSPTSGDPDPGSVE